MKWDAILSYEQGVSRESEWNPFKNSKFSAVSLPPLKQDHQRLVTSSAVRALQNKAQVFSLDVSTQIRTRLTHSMEVSEIARNLAMALPSVYEKSSSRNKRQKWQDIEQAISQLSEASDETGETQIDVIADILATAGLLHDIGNPPFGHRGESVITEWLGEWLQKQECPVKDPDLRADLSRCEGNAQAIRLLASEPKMGDLREIAVSHSVLSAMMKYTVPAIEYKDEFKEDPKAWRHKPGYYWSETEIIEQIANEMRVPKDEEGTHVRTPLAFLLEAADDIAYSTSDFEDSVLKDLITKDDIEGWRDCINEMYNGGDHDPDRFTSEWFEKIIEGMSGKKDDDLAWLHRGVFEMRNKMMYVALWVFLDNYNGIMKGKFGSELLKHDGSIAREVLNLYKQYMENNVYCSEEVKNSEDQGEKILRALLGWFAYFINREENDDFEALECKDCFKLLPERLKNRVRQMHECAKKIDRSASRDQRSLIAYYEMRAVLDYICLLTDEEARVDYERYNVAGQNWTRN